MRSSFDAQLEGPKARRLRTAALIAATVGALGSVGFMLHAGRHNRSRILPVIFALWVLSPYAALVSAALVSKRWPVLIRTTLYGVILVIASASLVSYAYVALYLPLAKATPVFVVVPPASWLLSAVVLAIAALMTSRRRSS